MDPMNESDSLLSVLGRLEKVHTVVFPQLNLVRFVYKHCTSYSSEDV